MFNHAGGEIKENKLEKQLTEKYGSGAMRHQRQSSGGGPWVGDGFISSEGIGKVTWEEAGMGVLNFFNPFRDNPDDGVIYSTMPDLPIGPGGAVRLSNRLKMLRRSL